MKIKRLVEWIVIGLFIAVVASVISITVYRSVVNSDWYNDKQTEWMLSQMIEKVNDADNIEYVMIDDNVGSEFYIYDVPEELFDDLTSDRYARIEDEEEQRRIWRYPFIAVYFNDGTTVSFNVTDSGEVYWGATEIYCPSLTEWFWSSVAAK